MDEFPLAHGWYIFAAAHSGGGARLLLPIPAVGPASAALSGTLVFDRSGLATGCMPLAFYNALAGCCFLPPLPDLVCGLGLAARRK